MEILAILIPVSLGLGAAGLAAFIWALRGRQYDDPKGDAERILRKDWDEHPKP
ncbi:cbb3-type cytochrome oxidase assembly protein CcoS [Paracoccus aestuariivivens]|uniref:Cbb3-type cytochrome oxidase assembly protein CcoS n=1 Tax=Paracoccus aestuariivivens TaxID=1820333 RepID=A0A6L6J747_9RHOB|nr:cbb3-type cytochrome oxidase assembly protein CcoS [Paracoccus aestuariivivens]MTH77406.1 cbb3-type cytochrome oxidase assembly protein CcoS [Paracoccus aestuariivivens]